MSTLTISTVQTHLHWEDRTANLSMLEEKIQGIREKTEIVILPEMFNSGFSMQPGKLAEPMDGETVTWMRRLAMEKRVILTGSLTVSEDSEGDGAARTKYYNRLVWMLPNGQYGYYDKRHRFAYGGEDDQYSPGNKRLIASVKNWKVNLLVCYDLRFPVWARQTFAGGQAEYDLLIYVANWPERRIHAWKTLLQARAIENQCYAVGVNRTGDDGNGIHYSGDTMVIDPMGQVLYTCHEREEIHTITLHTEHLLAVREKLPFLQDADRFTLLNEGDA